MAEMILVLGGAASGKSALAEAICCARGGEMAYIATMKPHGEEARARIARHRELRAGKGFDTVEWTGDRPLRLPSGYDVALLEDTGNFVANRIFGGGSAPWKSADLFAEIDRVAGQVDTFVLVANEVFSDIPRFDGEMALYLRRLGDLHRDAARKADVVVESVCGLPCVLKGEWRP